MKNQTLVFKKGIRTMSQVCGTNYPISKENVIKIMEKSGWELWKVLG